jgi:UDP-N-acetylmuramate--alanine ligase
MSDVVDSICWRLSGDRSAAIHLMGVGGVGMAGLAALLLDLGYQVEGCDLAPSPFLSSPLHQGGRWLTGHDPVHIRAGMMMLVRSTAVPDDHPEVEAARQLGVPVYRRGEVLAAVLRLQTHRHVVAVSGTHGKTTTTAMAVHLLEAAGLRPSGLIGGAFRLRDGAEGQVYWPGVGRPLVVEADESDGTLVHHQPDSGVLTGIDFDHMEHFPDEADFLAIFARFIRQVRDRLLICADDPRLLAMVKQVPVMARTISYGFASTADYCCVPTRLAAEGSDFELWHEGQVLGSFSLPVPGRHNLQNATAALALGHQLRAPIDQLATGLRHFKPVGRRFERVGQLGGVTVYSDYAHHPTEIRALIQAALLHHPARLLVIFEPHRYTRSKALGAEFPGAFEGVDHLFLAPIYAASEAPMPGGTNADLRAHFEGGAAGAKVIHAVDDLAAAWQGCMSEAQSGDMVLLVGAGTVDQLREKICDESI